MQQEYCFVGIAFGINDGNVSEKVFFGIDSNVIVVVSETGFGIDCNVIVVVSETVFGIDHANVVVIVNSKAVFGVNDGDNVFVVSKILLVVDDSNVIAC